MAVDIFRKKALDKLSSPEQLDKMIVITSPSVLLALAGGVFIILMAVLWGIFGRVPMTKEGNGILVREEGVVSVYAKTQGVVTKVHVGSGDVVNEGDILYEVANESGEKQIEDLRERIKQVEAVSYTSKDDKATADTQELLSIKNRRKTVSLESAANRASLKKLKKMYVTQKKKTEESKADYKEAKKVYYQSMSANDAANIEYQYQKASADYQTAQNVYQAAKSAYNTIMDTMSSSKVAMDKALKAYEKYKGLEGYAAQAQEAYAQAQEYKVQYQAATKKAAKQKKKLTKANETQKQKKKVYMGQKNKYESYIKKQGKVNAESTKAGNEYNIALTQYNTEKAKQESIKEEIATMEQQLSATDKSSVVTEKSLKAEFRAAKGAILSKLNTSLEEYTGMKDNLYVRSEYHGIVYMTCVANGSAITPETEVARISPIEEDVTLQAVYYFPLDSGKNIKEGMEINIYPTTLSKEEYGHMTGVVTSVTRYVSSYADMYAKLGDSTLVNEVGSQGAVMEVRCEIEKDASTASGYAWSSKKGRKEELAEATKLTGSVITKKVPPITMVVPKIKELLGIE